MTSDGAGIAYLCLVLAAVAAGMAITTGLVRSPFGRLIRAIRDDEDAVRSIGKSPARSKLVVFMIGAGMTGLAGALYAHYLTFISPDQFVPLLTFYVWIDRRGQDCRRIPLTTSGWLSWKAGGNQRASVGPATACMPPCRPGRYARPTTTQDPCTPPCSQERRVRSGAPHA